MNRANPARSIFAWSPNRSVRSLFTDRVTGRKYAVGFFFDFNKDFLVEVTPEVVEQIQKIFGTNLLNMGARQKYSNEIIALRRHILDSAREYLFLDHKILNYHMEVQRPNPPEYLGVHSSDIFLTGLECVRVRRENIDKKLFSNCNLFLVSL